MKQFLLEYLPYGYYRAVSHDGKLEARYDETGLFCTPDVNYCLDYLNLPKDTSYRVWVEADPKGEWEFLPDEDLLVWKIARWQLLRGAIQTLLEIKIPTNTRLNVWFEPL